MPSRPIFLKSMVKVSLVGVDRSEVSELATMGTGLCPLPAIEPSPSLRVSCKHSGREAGCSPGNVSAAGPVTLKLGPLPCSVCHAARP